MSGTLRTAAQEALEALKQDPTVNFMAPERADRRAP